MSLLFLRSYLEPLQPLRLIINKVRQAEKKRRNGRVNVRRRRDNSSSCRWNTTVILLTSENRLVFVFRNKGLRSHVTQKQTSSDDMMTSTGQTVLTWFDGSRRGQRTDSRVDAGLNANE